MTGCVRPTLRTGSYGTEALATAVKFASHAGLDLLTIDGPRSATMPPEKSY